MKYYNYFLSGTTLLAVIVNCCVGEWLIASVWLSCFILSAYFNVIIHFQEEQINILTSGYARAVNKLFAKEKEIQKLTKSLEIYEEMGTHNPKE